MTLYLLRDTDCECPTVREVVTGPAGFDFDAANKQWLKGKSKLDFTDWMCRYRGFEYVSYDEQEIAYFTKPSRGGSNGLPKELRRLIDTTIKSVAHDLTNRSDVLRLLKDGGKIRFDVGMK